MVVFARIRSGTETVFIQGTNLPAHVSENKPARPASRDNALTLIAIDRSGNGEVARNSREPWPELWIDLRQPVTKNGEAEPLEIFLIPQSVWQSSL